MPTEANCSNIKQPPNIGSPAEPSHIIYRCILTSIMGDDSTSSRMLPDPVCNVVDLTINDQPFIIATVLSNFIPAVHLHLHKATPNALLLIQPLNCLKRKKSCMQ